MNSKNDNEKRINTFLVKHKSEVDEMANESSNPKTKMNSLYDYLQRIDIAIQERKKVINEAEKVIRSNTINVYNIAQTSGISRKTFYNNPLLSEYVRENTNDGLNKSTLDTFDTTINQLVDDVSGIKRVNQRLTEQLEEIMRQNTELKEKLLSE